MAVLASLQNAAQWLSLAIQELEAEASQGTSGTETPRSPTSPIGNGNDKIAWGAKVSPEFKKRVLWIADQLGIDPSWLMACMAWESGRTFSPSIRNAAGSGATGLIQFMPNVATRLGTSSVQLAAMTAEDQLRFVYEYFQPFSHKLRNLGDCYMTILWPSAVGHNDDFVLFDRNKRPTAFRQNAGLDINHDGLVTRGECLVKINQMLTMGMLPTNAG